VSLADALTTIAYLIPDEKFVYQRGERWASGELVGREGITAHLLQQGMDDKTIAHVLATKSYTAAYGFTTEPNAGLVTIDKHKQPWLNAWVPPTLTPREGTYPRIERVLKHLTGYDDTGVEWICHWLALKVQNPGIVPKVAVVLLTKPAGGKGTLNRIIQEMLGPENCAVLERGALESRFNARWAGKLFVLADEVFSKEGGADISARLKVLIDAGTIEIEGKGSNQREITNRLAWLFASNDEVSPLIVEADDRRYSVFANNLVTPAEHKNMIDSLYESDRFTMTESFKAEISAFYYDLLHLEVDRRMVSAPYQNQAREDLIEANIPTHTSFFRHVDENGVDDLLEGVVLYDDFSLGRTRGEWDFGERGLSSDVLYLCYKKFCKESGATALKKTRWGVAAQKHGWVRKRFSLPDSPAKRPWGYTVRRTGAPVTAPGARGFDQKEAQA
jgi:phage/plasmid-associated DNA primase